MTDSSIHKYYRVRGSKGLPVFAYGDHVAPVGVGLPLVHGFTCVIEGHFFMCHKRRAEASKRRNSYG
jgi:hypothetical protein